MINKNITQTHNYEDFVKFIGNNLEDEVLSKYLSIAESHKNATYVAANAVKQFVNIIGNSMREKNFTNDKKLRLPDIDARQVYR